MPARRAYVDGPFGQVHYRHQGSGPAVIVLGGAPRSSSQFDPLLEALAARGLHAIAPDMPGFGLSDPPPEGTGIAAMAAFLAPVLDALGVESACLFGLHSGSKVASAFAADFPARASGLIVAGKSHSLVPDRERRNATMGAVVEERYFANGAQFVDGPQALRGWAAAQRNLSKSWWDDVLFTADDQEAAIRALEAKIADDLLSRRTVRDFYAANFAYDFAGDLARVTCPALIVEITSVAEDRTIGRQAKALAGSNPRISTAELPQIEGLGLFLHAGFAPIANMIADFVG